MVNSPCCGINSVSDLSSFRHLRCVFETVPTVFRRNQSLFVMTRWLKCTFAEHPRMSPPNHGTAWKQTTERLSIPSSFCVRVLVYPTCARAKKTPWWQRRRFVQSLWAHKWLHMHARARGFGVVVMYCCTVTNLMWLGKQPARSCL